MMNCNTIKADGFWCGHRATVVADDGHSYCPRHAPKDGKGGGAYPPVSDKRRKIS
jgi:hypothetical protein